ncbi:Uncharacterised protein [Mycobacteroides abscessus subsp. massiliense]|uniref:Possible cell wall protein n=1 Tax=Mycolicibacterium fortuitum subsp. acetamidolyticum TaxID=144550 RepID=A0A100WY30_MYCFO|nr:MULTISPECIES: hypothetical protein [Mycobacteriaceae]MCV7143873.1 hypothetical protein [Mycolicibacterium fortuitum]SKM23261.1 Uncharacterised protein [Mycobacteroides abscessus subsp. abscessus]SKM87554.1 Uncharacterised protein [Mycobacteroides abscessus subsp. massiliense]SKN98758.1 Uncharacterised protein [Mycobacteroides abscessus subsp. massiliense]SKO00548.1 Uncharacterised protein [Mycobacteroides abscessus subsp. massiliense]
MADGLDSLTAMRSKSTTSRRTIPPPRHQPRRTPVDMPAAEPSPAAVSEQPKAQRPAAPASAATPPASGTDLTKVSIYLDDTADASLEAVRAAARATKPRVDATRSAVVRLALNRLAEQLTPAEIVAELQRSAAAHNGPGRKRA